MKIKDITATASWIMFFIMDHSTDARFIALPSGDFSRPPNRSIKCGIDDIINNRKLEIPINDLNTFSH